MAQFIMPPQGAGYSIDPNAAARARNEQMMGITQGIGSSLGTLLQSIEQQRQANANKRMIDAIMGGGDLQGMVKAAQGTPARTGLAGILDAFNPNVAPTGTPDMLKSAVEGKLKTMFKTPKEELEEKKIEAEIKNLEQKTKVLGDKPRFNKNQIRVLGGNTLVAQDPTSGEWKTVFSVQGSNKIVKASDGAVYSINSSNNKTTKIIDSDGTMIEDQTVPAEQPQQNAEPQPQTGGMSLTPDKIQLIGQTVNELRKKGWNNEAIANALKKKGINNTKMFGV